MDLPAADCSCSLGHTTNISPVEDRNGTRKIIFPWSKMARLLGTSSGLAIGKDRTIPLHLGTGPSRVESYLVMVSESPHAYRARPQRGLKTREASWGQERSGTSALEQEVRE